jgi:hypothetical protein
MSDDMRETDSHNSFILRLLEENNKRYEQRFADAKIAVDLAFSSQKELVQSALISAKEAVTKAESASEKRFDAVNEFRNTLSDQQRTLMPRAEAEIVFQSLRDRLETLEGFDKIKAGEKKGAGEIIAWTLAAIVVIAAIFERLK